MPSSFSTSDRETALQVSKANLAVVLLEKEEKALKKLKNKPDKLKAYEESIDAFNSYLKQAVEREWSLSKEVKFISESEAELLKEKKDPNYFLLTKSEVTNYKMGAFGGVPNRGLSHPQDMLYHLSSAGQPIALAIPTTCLKSTQMDLLLRATEYLFSLVTVFSNSNDHSRNLSCILP